MSGFRETFTRGEKENILGYDDSASLYFVGCVLICVLVPWTYSFIKRLIWPSSSCTSSSPLVRQCSCSVCINLREKVKQKTLSWSSKFNASFLTQLFVLITLWIGFIKIAVDLSNTTPIVAFDPFEILGVSSFASVKDVRRAYRTLSLIHHPDRAKDDPDSAARFILISKAYQALTDEVDKRPLLKWLLVFVMWAD